MYQLGIRFSIAGTKSYVELDKAKLPQLAGMLITLTTKIELSDSAFFND